MRRTPSAVRRSMSAFGLPSIDRRTACCARRRGSRAAVAVVAATMVRTQNVCDLTETSSHVRSLGDAPQAIALDSEGWAAFRADLLAGQSPALLCSAPSCGGPKTSRPKLWFLLRELPRGLVRHADVLKMFWGHARAGARDDLPKNDRRSTAFPSFSQSVLLWHSEGLAKPHRESGRLDSRRRRSIFCRQTPASVARQPNWTAKACGTGTPMRGKN